MKRKHYHTTFGKLTAAFIGFGLVPLLLLGVVFLLRYAGSTRDTSVKNYTQITSYFARNINDMFDSVNEAMGALYDYEDTEGNSLAAVLKSFNFSDIEREKCVSEALESVMEQSEYISSERFADYRGNIYSRYHDQDKTLRNDALTYTGNDILEDNLRGMLIIGTMPESSICVNSDDYIVTMVRNFMNTTTVETTYTESLGTLYADINVSVLEDYAKDSNVGTGMFYVYSTEAKHYIFSQNTEDYKDGSDPLAEYLSYLTRQSGYEKVGSKWIFYEQLGEMDVYAVLLLDNTDIVGDFVQTRMMIIVILSFSCAFLMVLYMLFSNRMSAPAQKLEAAMRQIEEGNLDVRVKLDTNDEMEFIANGFNKMAENLTDYINQVYVAQICQQDAELNALKMQIRPHFLYNTLDVIRMTALDEGDEKTAELLECLAHQLRYVMGEHDEWIALADELEAIRQYFVIMRTRYEERIQLHINVRSEDLSLRVMKMLLQPMVENAVKHGLRDKEGTGTVAINVFRREDYLEIIVMDDGVGMDEAKVHELTEKLGGKVGVSNGKVSIGMKNVYDRIKLNCGDQYGFEIESVKGVGTVITFRLPLGEEI